MRILPLFLLLVTGCSLPSFLVTPVARTTGLEETTVAEGGRDKVLIVPLEGLLVNARSGGGFLGGPGENKVSLLAEQLTKAADDGNIKAVVLRISSPGGTVTSSDTLYELIRDFREDTGKPVVASVQEVGASGGYYVALAADEIWAQPTSVVGSIGVLVQTFDASGTLDMIGLKTRALTSGKFKDMGSPFDSLEADEEAVLQKLVDSYFVRFVDKVNQRPEVDEQVFDGRVLSGEQALAAGLLDGTGFLDDAIDRAADLADVTNPKVILYKRPYGYEGSIYANTHLPSPAMRQPLVNLPEGTMLESGFYYLWRGGRQ